MSTRKPKPEFELSNRLGLTVEEAADTIGVSERHLRSLLPEIPHCRVGSRVVVPVEPLRQWLHERAQAEQQGAEVMAREIVESLESGDK